MHSIPPFTTISLDDIKTEQDKYRLLSLSIYAFDVACEYAKEYAKPFKFHASDFKRNRVECFNAIAWYNISVRISNFVNDWDEPLSHHPLNPPKNERL